MKDFIALLKLPPSILSAISLATGFVLFVPEKILLKLGLHNIPPLWRTIIGITFIISTSIISIYFTLKLINMIYSKILTIRYNFYFPKMMKELTTTELIIPVMLFNSPNFTSFLPHSDGVTLRLLSKGVIQYTSSNNIATGNRLFMLFTITPKAQNFLSHNRELLNKFSKQQLQSLYNEMNDSFHHY